MKNKKNKQKKWWLDAICGSIIGFINGFLGSGGGMLAVPILQKEKKLSEKQAHATAIAVMLPFSLISAVIYSFNFELDWVIVGVLAGSVTIGGVVGCFCLKKMNNKVIKIIFAVVLAVAGVWLLWK